LYAKTASAQGGLAPVRLEMRETLTPLPVASREICGDIVVGDDSVMTRRRFGRSAGRRGAALRR